MSFAYLDASALAKRYVPEPGTAEINHIITRLPPSRIVVFNIGVAEVVSLLVRKRNSGKLSAELFQQALANFIAEIVRPIFPVKLSAGNVVVFAALALIDAHSINSTDAIILQTAKTLVVELRPLGEDLLVVSSDRRLLNAARLEGLATFDPELQTIAEFEALIAD